MLFELNQHEHEVLLDVVSSALSGVHEAAGFEQNLKQREHLLVGLLERLKAAEASGLSIGEPTAINCPG